MLRTHSRVGNKIFSVLEEGMGVAARRDFGAFSDASGLHPFPERMNSLSHAALYVPIDEPCWGPVLECLDPHFIPLMDLPGTPARRLAAAGLAG